MNKGIMKTEPKVSLLKVVLMFCLSAAIVMGTMPCEPFLMRVHAAPAEKTIVCLGAETLSNNCAKAGAATVYYGQNGGVALTWRVINYDGHGALSNGGNDNLTLLAAGLIGKSSFSERSNKHNRYGTSVLKSNVDKIFSDDYFTEKERRAIKKRELLSGNYIGINTDCIGGDALTGDAAPYLWPLSGKEANIINTSVKDTGDNYLIVHEDWWLRSPSDQVLSGMDVAWDGEIRFRIGDATNLVIVDKKVRPAFNIGFLHNSDLRDRRGAGSGI